MGQLRFYRRVGKAAGKQAAAGFAGSSTEGHKTAEFGLRPRTPPNSPNSPTVFGPLNGVGEVVFCKRPAAQRPVLGPPLPPNDRC